MCLKWKTSIAKMDIKYWWWSVSFRYCRCLRVACSLVWILNALPFIQCTCACIFHPDWHNMPGVAGKQICQSSIHWMMHGTFSGCKSRAVAIYEGGINKICSAAKGILDIRVVPGNILSVIALQQRLLDIRGMPDSIWSVIELIW